MYEITTGRAIIVSLINTGAAAHAARKWETFTLPLGQVVNKGRYYFVWGRGRFIGTYQTLDDAVESLERVTRKTTH
jgi:hypothetical protein